MGLLGTWGCRNLREYIRHPWDLIGGASLQPALSSVDFLLVSLEIYFKVINLGFFFILSFKLILVLN